MAEDAVVPPGQHPYDPSVKDIDPIGFALGKVQTMLLWISEHRASFEKLRNSDPQSAECELRYLENATVQAMQYIDRLIELILEGFTIDPAKRLPSGLRAGQESIKRALRASRDAVTGDSDEVRT